MYAGFTSSGLTPYTILLAPRQKVMLVFLISFFTNEHRKSPESLKGRLARGLKCWGRRQLFCLQDTGVSTLLSNPLERGGNGMRGVCRKNNSVRKQGSRSLGPDSPAERVISHAVACWMCLENCRLHGTGACSLSLRMWAG